MILNSLMAHSVYRGICHALIPQNKLLNRRDGQGSCAQTEDTLKARSRERGKEGPPPLRFSRREEFGRRAFCAGKVFGY